MTILPNRGSRFLRYSRQTAARPLLCGSDAVTVLCLMAGAALLLWGVYVCLSGYSESGRQAMGDMASHVRHAMSAGTEVRR